MSWYEIENIEDIDSPSVVLYEERLMYNLHKMLNMVGGNPTKLMPHIKTHKMPEIVARMLVLGIKDFKASTIAEAEIAAREGAATVLVAHQLVGPKIQRFGSLITHFPKTEFSTIVDHMDTVEKLAYEASQKDIKIGIYIDINNGMDRSGIAPDNGLYELITALKSYPALHFKGFHIYDGHLRDQDFQERKNKIESNFTTVHILFEKIKEKYPEIQLICGGTPSFTSHLSNTHRICSPGTCLLWDWNYDEKLIEQEFKFAALLICRVISKPKKGIVTIDLGHKAVASENPIDHRVKFLNLTDYKLLSQSEEHGVLAVKNWTDITVGTVLYGVPYHICPTVHLYDDVALIVDGKQLKRWEVTARKRKITV